MRDTRVAQGERLGRNLSGNAWTLVSSLTVLFYFCWLSRVPFWVHSLDRYLVWLNH